MQTRASVVYLHRHMLTLLAAKIAVRMLVGAAAAAAFDMT